MPQPDQLITNLYKVGAIKRGTFKLASGQMSDYYVDLKLALCRPVLLKMVASRLKRLSKTYVPVYQPVAGPEDWIWAGVALGAVPLAVACSIASARSYIMVRKEAKAHGTGQLLEGPYKPGQGVVLVEDVVTTGGSSMQAVRALKDAGLIVLGVLAVVDRQAGGAELFYANRVSFEALVTATQILQYVKED